MKESNRTYYGEYSLGYWIKLIQNRSIVLPEYQRHFVWPKAKVEALVAALKAGRFIPPITIGAFRKENEVINYLIDGQQRLTSLLLAYIGRYPLLEKFEAKGMNLATDAVVDDDAEGEGFDYGKEWTFKEIISEGDNSEAELRQRCSGEQYENLSNTFSAADLTEIFIGFSYIVPGSRNPKEQQEFYTREFKDLNTTSSSLNPLESRRSLYFWHEEFKEFFEPEFVRHVIHRAVPKASRPCCLDFVRYLAILSDYAKTERTDSVAKGWKKNLEGYYFEYICSVVEERPTELFKCYKEIFGELGYTSRMQELKRLVAKLCLMHEYQSIIDIDMNFFGLVYWVLFKGCTVNPGMVDDLKTSLTNKIRSFRNDAVHARAPGLLKYLRQRLQVSCEIYSSRVIGNE